MSQRSRRRRFEPGVSVLEGRQLLSTAAPNLESWLRSYAGSIPSALRRLPNIPTSPDGSGYQAILNALRGGPGSEFVSLIRRYVPNPTAIARQFAFGQRTEFTIPGFAVRTPKLLDSYTGPRLDQFNPTASGLVRQRTGEIVAGAIMRGPIDLPLEVRYVWGFDRGIGQARPVFGGQADPRVDSLLTVIRSADGSTSARFTDLATDQATILSGVVIQIEGPTVRARLSPSTSAALGLNGSQVRYAFWTEGGTSEGRAAVGQFIPGSTIPIGDLGPARFPRPRR